MLTSLSASAVLGEQIYGPYGNQRYTQGTMGTDKGYTGQFQDAATGLDYYNARYYDPVMGQFLSADHVQGNPQGMDPYAYVDGNPETATDPTGECAFCIAIPLVDVLAEAALDVVAAVVTAVASPVVLAVVVVVIVVVIIAAIAHFASQANNNSSNYQPNPKHKPGKTTTASNGQSSGAEPTNAQSLWDDRNSSTTTVWKGGGNTDRWVGYDPDTGEIIIFDDTNNGDFHSHVETWQQLAKKPWAQKILTEHGIFDKNGKFQKSWTQTYQDQVAQAQAELRKAAEQEAKSQQYRNATWYKEWAQ